jgi:hypothetical protein
MSKYSEDRMFTAFVLVDTILTQNISMSGLAGRHRIIPWSQSPTPPPAPLWSRKVTDLPHNGDDHQRFDGNEEKEP